MGYWLGPCVGYCCSREHVLRRTWTERFEVARDVADALNYLHGQDVVYRDLKPDNIGFDESGELKMFDFGLAKRVTIAERTQQEGGDGDESDLYKLTGNTGSLRYMAPEVATNMPYGLSVDAYSYGVLFWQLCSLSVPYSGYSCKMHADLVVGKGHRPKCDASWPESWRELMGRCWSADRKVRPTFEHILKVTSDELEEWTAGGDDDDFMPNEDGPGGRDAEKIRARSGKRRSVIKIRARRDGQRLDVDTRLTRADGPTERKHDAAIV